MCRLISTEQTRLAKVKSLTLQASPSQQSSALFQLLSSGSNEVFFENLDHDFLH
jgi:hypothetical protein